MEHANDLDGKPGSLDRLRERETPWINLRRHAHRINQHSAPVGLALSGGGIRSATFSLGFLQALSASGHLKCFDYLSTVSGGSYIGSAFGALFVPPEGRGGSTQAERPDFDNGTPLQSARGVEAVRRLRDSGRYLTPAGTSDAFFGAAVVMRNWAAVQFTIGISALFLFWACIVCDSLIPFTAQVRDVSPTLLFLVYASSFMTAAPGIAYWLTRRDSIPLSRFQRVTVNAFFWLLLLALAYVGAGWVRPDSYAGWFSSSGWGTGWFGCTFAAALILHIHAEWKYGAVELVDVKGWSSEKLAAARQRLDLESKQARVTAEDRVRSAHSRVLTTNLMMALALLALLSIDWLGHGLGDRAKDLVGKISQHQFRLNDLARQWPTLIAVVPPLFSWLGSRHLKTMTTSQDGTDPASKLPIVILVGGLLLLAAWMILWSAAAHGLDDKIGKTAKPQHWAVLGSLFVANLVTSISYSFINLSSLATFYTSRLRRAYIGASSYGTPFTSVKADDPEDNITLTNYYKFGLDAGAPLHLINVTIAETVPGGSNLVARDRKGKPMSLSPAGIAFEADYPGETAVRDLAWGETLPLANWIAISGAAVSTAMGSATTLGLSILTTMVNTRLGYWWRRDNGKQGIFWRHWRDTVQHHLFSELRGAFLGTVGARWYLTDGGHFENTGVYALLQRKLPFIVLSDNGADPDYRMQDLVRLIGRSRTDLGIDIHFLDADELESKLGAGSPLLQAIGPLSGLVRGSRTQSGGPIAALARITYKNKQEGHLLLVKPRLTFLEPPEVLAYHVTPGCGDFPQETTADQFFDEVQWEAYRRLGELAGEALFPQSRSNQALWMPSDELPS